MSTDRTRYRPDIDGLRAIAVSAVVGFHAFPAFFPGGFLGVDVFFVISGYLITRIIRDRTTAGRFSLPDFYAGRIRRLAPSLIAVLAATFLVGLGGLLASELADLGGQMAAAAGFVANLRFALESGYFDSAAETKPLLHLWSLGVEEQFYLFWPVLLVLVAGERTRRRSTIGIAIISLAAALAANRLYPGPAFYLPIGRLWEVLIGAAIALRAAPDSGPIRGPEVAAKLGLLAVFLAFFVGAANRGNPVLGAATATLATGLLIVSGPGTRVARTLARAPLRRLGEISYPLYLWHWPILVFVRIFRGEEPGAGGKLAAIAAALALSEVTYRFVETPIRFRRPPIEADRRMIFALLSLVTLIGGIGLVTVYADGFPGRIRGVPSAIGERDIQRKGAIDPECPLEGRARSEAFWCRVSDRKPNRALIGDSHAVALWAELARGARDGERWSAVGTPGCIPFPKANEAANRPDCDRVAEASFRAAETPDIESILIVVSVGALNFRNHDETYFRNVTARALAAVSKLRKLGKKIVLLVDNPRVSANPERCGQGRPFEALGIRTNPKCAISRDAHEAYLSETRRFLVELKGTDPGIALFDPTDALCPGTECTAILDGRALYTYDDHLSAYGVSRFIEPLRDLVSRK